MNKSLLMILLLSFYFRSQGQLGVDSASKKGIHFCGNTSWQAIKEKAKREHKYIFVDCFATWCGPCKQMDKSVYPTDSVGDFYNKTFISFKIQCDTSRNDDEVTKAAYADAHQLLTEYKIDAYPTFLYFSPDGKLVHKGLGYKEPADFVSLGQNAIDPDKQYFTLLKDYQEGKTDYAKLPYLAKMATVFRDLATSSLVKRDYIHNYLNRLPDAEMASSNNLQALREYVKELRSSDASFQWVFKHPQLADSIMNKKGFSIGLVVNVTYKEEVQPMLDMAKKNNVTPNWNKMERELTAEIGTEGTKKAMQRSMMEWYDFKKDWENYYAIVIEIVEARRNKDNHPTGLGEALSLNDAAYFIFLRCSDRNKLEKALSWMDSVVSNMTDSSNFAQFLFDTKAELLYKLSRKEEALALEARAVRIAPQDKLISDSYKKMQEGKPTW